MSYCGVSQPIEHLYQHAAMFSVLPIAFAGPIVGGLATMFWWMAAIGSVAACLRHLWRVGVSATIEHL